MLPNVTKNLGLGHLHIVGRIILKWISDTTWKCCGCLWVRRSLRRAVVDTVMNRRCP